MNLWATLCTCQYTHPSHPATYFNQFGTSLDSLISLLPPLLSRSRPHRVKDFGIKESCCSCSLQWPWPTSILANKGHLKYVTHQDLPSLMASGRPQSLPRRTQHIHRLAHAQKTTHALFFFPSYTIVCLKDTALIVQKYPSDANLSIKMASDSNNSYLPAVSGAVKHSVAPPWWRKKVK